jgi:hypothetical protein
MTAGQPAEVRQAYVDAAHAAAFAAQAFAKLAEVLRAQAGPDDEDDR